LVSGSLVLSELTGLGYHRELVPGLVRFYGLYLSAQHLNDITYITTTGIFVSQLEVEFGVTAACVPTVLRIVTEGWHRVRFRVLGVLPPAAQSSDPSGANSLGLQTIGGVRSRGKNSGTKTSVADIMYSNWDEAGEEEDTDGGRAGGNRGGVGGGESGGELSGKNDSQEKIIARDERGQIRVQQSYAVSSQSRRSGDEDDEDGEAVPAYGKGHARAYLVVGAPEG
jgi:hypothetical protein